MMNTVEIKEVAQTILGQLNLNRMEVFAWGSKDFKAIYEQVDEEKLPGLMWSIRTPKIRKGGRVQILLNFNDAYIVRAFRLINDERKDMVVESDIYFDQLHDVINSLIEDNETLNTIIF